MHVAAILALLCPGVLFCSGSAGAQMIDFGQINSFEIDGHGHAARWIAAKDDR